MALDSFINFGDAEVDATGYNSSATTVTLASGHGARWAALTPPYNVTWWEYSTYPNPSDDPNREIVTVTNRSTDTLTVTRGQESISASTKNTGGATYRMLPTLTAKTLNTDLPATYAALAGAAFTGAVSVGSTGTPGLTLIGDGGAASLYMDTYSASTQNIFRYRRARGTLAAPLRAQLGDALGNIQFWGAAAATNTDPASFTTASAVIRALATQDIASGTTGGKLELLTTANGASSTVARATIDSSGVTIPTSHGFYGDLFSGLTKGKIVFNPGGGADGQLQLHPSGEARPLVQLEDAIASGGTDRTDTRLTIWGRSGVGAVADFFTAQINLGSIDGSSAAAAYGLIVDGRWTNGGGFNTTSTQFLLHDEINVRNIIRHVQSDALSVQFFDATAGNIKIGGTAARSGTAGTNQLVFYNGATPTGTLTNGASFYAVSGEIRAKDSNGVEARPMRPNGRGHARCQGYAFP